MALRAVLAVEIRDTDQDDGVIHKRSVDFDLELDGPATPLDLTAAALAQAPEVEHWN